jgi:hypothetical protein
MLGFGNGISKHLQERLTSLEHHLAQEHPALVGAVPLYRELDRTARRMGLLPEDESFALRIAWWPLIAVLGTFSAGKSTFINQYYGRRLQSTGNQAVDDKFTVICYTGEGEARVLPGQALNSDPRFPFFQISREIEKVVAGEGRRIDSYLQLKTCPCEPARGRILIDSPGFDADSQRSSTLRITEHIIDLSDLVLVFFDARHPEPGAMQDTLNRLVADTIRRPDATKFLFVLNQIDTAAGEDNPEEVVAAWQRALAQKGLTSGRFYTIYSAEVAVPIEDEARRARFEAKRDRGLAEIRTRMDAVEVERAYRIIGNVEKTARQLEEGVVPRLAGWLATWRRRVLWTDAALVAAALAAAIGLVAGGLVDLGAVVQGTRAQPVLGIGAAAAAAAAFLGLHFWFRRLWARRVARAIPERTGPNEPDLRGGFTRSTRPLRSLLRKQPAGWSARTRRRLHELMRSTAHEVQRLNDRFTDPSGRAVEAPAELEGERAAELA